MIMKHDMLKNFQVKLKHENTLHLNYIKMLTGIDFSIDDVNISSNVLSFLYIQVSRKIF